MANFKHIDGVKIVANELMKLGLEVQYTAEREMPIDILVELQNDIIIKLIVRIVSPDSQYTWIEQSKFDTKDNFLYLAVLYRKSAINNTIYLFPASNWNNDNPPFRVKNYDKPDLVSKPEYGINFSYKTLESIENYRLPIIISKLNNK
jgi:hypothetical protein